MISIRILFTYSLLFITLSLNADFQKGQEVFNNKCSSCHGKHISISILKENFFEKKNKLLDLKAPPVNMIVYDIMRGSKKLGTDDDLEMRQVEIEEFLKSYLENPKLENSLTDESILPYFDKKTSMKINEDEASFLAQFIMDYKKKRKKSFPKKKKNLIDLYDDDKLLDKAKKENKKILVYATSETCVYCKKMEKEVLSLNEIKQMSDKIFLFIKVDVDKVKLPLNLKKYYKNMTPTFFFISKENKVENIYPGSWKKKDYIRILKENI